MTLKRELQPLTVAELLTDVDDAWDALLDATEGEVWDGLIWPAVPLTARTFGFT